MAIRGQVLRALSHSEHDQGRWWTIDLCFHILTPIQEIDLLLSPSIPALLLPALPFVLITSDLQVFSAGALGKGFALGDVSLTKIFLTKQVEDLKDEFLSVKDLGAGATEEWLKGLEARGKEQRLDTDRWEKWESNGGLHQLWESQLSTTLHNVKPPSGEPRAQLDIDHTIDNPPIVLPQNSRLAMAISNTNPDLQPILPLKIESKFHLSISQIFQQANPLPRS